MPTRLNITVLIFFLSIIIILLSSLFSPRKGFRVISSEIRERHLLSYSTASTVNGSDALPVPVTRVADIRETDGRAPRAV